MRRGKGGCVGNVKRSKDSIWHVLIFNRVETQVMCEAQATTIAVSDRCRQLSPVVNGKQLKDVWPTCINTAVGTPAKRKRRALPRPSHLLVVPLEHDELILQALVLALKVHLGQVHLIQHPLQPGNVGLHCHPHGQLVLVPGGEGRQRAGAIGQVRAGGFRGTAAEAPASEVPAKCQSGMERGCALTSF